MEIRSATEADWEWIIEESGPIGGAQVVSLGVLHSLRDHEAIVAIQDDQRIGFAVYRLALPGIELLGLRAVSQWVGIGTSLLKELEEVAKNLGAATIWLCTTNDNLSAIRFYQRRGYHLNAIHPGEFRNVLEVKGYDPDTEVVGQDGIIIRDEIVLEKPIL
jgi:ribosomal protein S18 acetylase RimI-like enzyme